jgi:hypothetical protein
VTGVACATITVGKMASLVDGAAPDAFKGRPMRRKLTGRLRHVTTLVGNAGRENAREPRATRRAVHALTSLNRFIKRSATHQRIDAGLAAALRNLATEARSALGT